MHVIRYSTRISNYLARITLSDLTYMMSMTDLVALGIEIPRIYIGCSLEFFYIELIGINP